MSTSISEIAVVIPARNEASLLPAALDALASARSRFTREIPAVPVSVTVVLDCTTDNSRELLAGLDWVRTINVWAGRVGEARNAGIAAAWSRSGTAAGGLWLANTDADSEVPDHWLTRQYELATTGAALVVGTVEPRSLDLGTTMLKRWAAAHHLHEGHDHIHGANLGFRSDVFAGVGGFANQGLHEDRDFVLLARERGYAAVATDSCRVRTSGRLQGRVHGGFADFLSRLAQETECARSPVPASAPDATAGSLASGATAAGAGL